MTTDNATTARRAEGTVPALVVPDIPVTPTEDQPQVYRDPRCKRCEGQLCPDYDICCPK